MKKEHRRCNEMRRALWIDDDGEDRFPYERHILENHGLRIDWAVNATEAAARLSTTAYELILLDQAFPLSGNQASDVDIWSGCCLLYWLRGFEAPEEAPQAASWKELIYYKTPLLENQDIPIIIISGFQDDNIDRALRVADSTAPILPKPFDGDELLQLIADLLMKN